MPVRNPHPVYFRAAVQSLLAQTFDDFELIITEDPGETSASPLLAELSDSRIVHQRNERRTSLIEQRNHGFETARSEIVALADADDVSDPLRLARELSFLETHPDTDLVGSALTLIDGAGKALGRRTYPSDHTEILAALRRYNPIAQPSVMLRKRRVLDAGGYTYTKYAVNSDYDLWCRLARAGARFANLPEPLVQYRIHPDNLKSSKLRDVIAATIDIKKTYFSGALGLRGHARLGLERALMFLPPPWVLKAFVATQYRRRR